MEKIVFDSGVREYRLGSAGVLKFNPGDPNLYARFMEAGDKLRGLEKELVGKAQGMEPGGEAAVALMTEADKKMKQVLDWVFGQENDFDKILGGVNLLAVAGNGQRVVTNLLEALQPILVEGAERCVQDKTQAAVEKAKARRSTR